MLYYVSDIARGPVAGSTWPWQIWGTRQKNKMSSRFFIVPLIYGARRMLNEAKRKISSSQDLQTRWNEIRTEKKCATWKSWDLQSNGKVWEKKRGSYVPVGFNRTLYTHTFAHSRVYVIIEWKITPLKRAWRGSRFRRGKSESWSVIPILHSPGWGL